MAWASDQPIPFWRDRVFWLALAAGPIAWAGLVAAVGAGEPARWLAEPLRFAWLVLLLPLLEELGFRGGLQTLLLRRTTLRLGPLTLANWVTALAFSAAHIPAQGPGWAALVLAPALVFGWLRERSGGVSAPIVLHVVYNTGFLLLVGG